MKELDKYCHDCGKKVNNWDFFCEDCYGKKKYRWAFNIIGFTFGFCEMPIAFLFLLVIKDAKLPFYKWIKYGVIASIIVFLVIFGLRFLA